MDVRRLGWMLLLLPMIGCGLPTLQGGVRYGTFEPTGDFGISSSGVVAQSDVEDAGFDRDDSVPSATIDFKWGAPHFTLSALQASFEGNGRLDAEVSQGGNTIPAGANVRSEMDLDIYSGIVTFDLLPSSFELGIGGGVTAFDLDASIRDRDTGIEVSTDEIAPIPVVALRAGVEFGDFALSGLVSGMDIDVNDVDVAFYDVDVYARWRFIGGNKRVRGSLLAGWRQIGADFDYEDSNDDVEGDLTMFGPYIGLEIAF